MTSVQDILERYKRCAGCGRIYEVGSGDGGYCDADCQNIGPDHEMLESLRSVARQIGHTPTANEVNALCEFSHPTYYRRFGSLRRAQELAGLTPNKRGRPRGRTPLPEDFA